MNIGRLCQHNVVIIRPTEDLTHAAKLMREEHVGYLIVVEPGLAGAGDNYKPIGVLTDRDIVISVVAREVDARTLRVEDVMTRQPVMANESDSLETALQAMRQIGVRRLPIVGCRGELTGVLSLDDVLDAMAAQLQDLAGSVRRERTIETALRP